MVSANRESANSPSPPFIQGDAILSSGWISIRRLEIFVSAIACSSFRTSSSFQNVGNDQLTRLQNLLCHLSVMFVPCSQQRGPGRLADHLRKIILVVPKVEVQSSLAGISWVLWELEGRYVLASSFCSVCFATWTVIWLGFSPWLCYRRRFHLSVSRKT